MIVDSHIPTDFQPHHGPKYFKWTITYPFIKLNYILSYKRATPFGLRIHSDSFGKLLTLTSLCQRC